MARFIEIKTGDAVRPTVLVGSDQILAVVAGDGTANGANPATKATIFQNGLTSHIVFTYASSAGNDLAEAIQAAITANPGGIKSKVAAKDFVISDVVIT